MVGSALMRQLVREGYSNIVTRTHAELDLTDQLKVRHFFEENRPEYVFLAAGKVGGILANNTYPAHFISENLSIQANVLEGARQAGVKRLLFVGSSCIYPRDCPQPIKEEYLLTGPLELTNRPYALAKITGIEMCWAFNRQYDTRFLAVMPTNLYGPGDNYDLQGSHVLPALVRKIHGAKVNGDREVVLWGTGKPRREFLYSEDMTAALMFLMTLPDDQFSVLLRSRADQPPLINIGCGEDLTIAELARMIADVIGYTGTFSFDASKPDGTFQKLLDVSRISCLGWQAKTSLSDGIERAYGEFRESESSLRLRS